MTVEQIPRTYHSQGCAVKCEQLDILVETMRSKLPLAWAKVSLCRNLGRDAEYQQAGTSTATANSKCPKSSKMGCQHLYFMNLIWPREQLVSNIWVSCGKATLLLSTTISFRVAFPFLSPQNNTSKSREPMWNRTRRYNALLQSQAKCENKC